MSLFIGVTSFLLIRHGETDWNKEGRLQGQSNEAQLTQQGEDQAQHAANILFNSLKDKQIEIWTSGLARTDKTASIIAKTLNYPENAIQSDARLKEANHGQLEGKTAAEYEIDPSYQRWENLTSKEQFFNAMDGAQGESYNKVASRAKAALMEIEKLNPQTIKIIVTHGGVINALRKEVTGTYEFPNIKNGEVIVLQKNENEFTLTTFENFIAESQTDS